MFIETMFPPVAFAKSDRPVVLTIGGKELSDAEARGGATWLPQIHLNSHRPLWAIGVMRAVVQRDHGHVANSAASDTMVVYFSASVKCPEEDAGMTHILLRTTIGEAMSCNFWNCTLLELYVRRLATPVRQRRARDAFVVPKPDFFQSGVQKLIEKAGTELLTQPGGPSHEECNGVLGNAAVLLARMGKRTRDTS